MQWHALDSGQTEKTNLQKDSIYRNLLKWLEKYLIMEGTLDTLFKEEVRYACF